MARAGPFSTVDAAWLRMEDPTNLMMVTGILEFEERLELARLRTILERRLLRFDRFRQRVVEAPLGIGPPRWVEDDRFDLDAHVHHVSLPEPGGQPALQELVSDLMSTPLDYSKPLWQVHLIDGVGRNRSGSALLARLHHCIADGIALIAVLLSTTDSSARGGGGGRMMSARAPDGGSPLASLAGFAVQGIGLLANEPFKLLEYAQLGSEAAATLQRLTLLPPDPATPLKGRLGVRKRAAWTSTPIPLRDVKAAGTAVGATINDVLVNAAAGALREYLLGRGFDVDQLEIRAAVPVNLRPLEQGLQLGNNFGVVYLGLPLRIGDGNVRLFELKRRMDAIKRSLQAPVSYGVLSAIGIVPRQLHPRLVEFYGSKATLVLTNVPGPREPIYMAGTRITNAMFWVPMSGHLGLGFSILSYAGSVVVGVATDAGLVPDPGTLVRAFEAELRGTIDVAAGSARAGDGSQGRTGRRPPRGSTRAASTTRRPTS
jgi:WS/DGAT/MGAT family acyltransferase